MVWGLTSSTNGAKVRYFSPTFRELQLNRDVFQITLHKPEPLAGSWIWRLLPVNVEGTVTPSQSSSETTGSDSLPSYDGGTTGQSSAHTQHSGSERDDFGTIVTEVTTVTTRKRYRVEDV
jgi:hypothetical protein